jgi:hypothetical protein
MVRELLAVMILRPVSDAIQETPGTFEKSQEVTQLQVKLRSD